MGRTGPAKRVCTSSPPSSNTSATGSRHEVLPSRVAEGTADASALVGLPREVAAFSFSEHTQGVAEDSGLPREVAPKPLQVSVESVVSRTTGFSSQNLAAPLGATTLAVAGCGSASCERPLDPRAKVAPSHLHPFVDNVSNSVSPQGGAVELGSPEPLTLAPASHSHPSAQAVDPEDLAKELLVTRTFSAAAALQLVDLLPRDSGLRRVQGNGGSRLAFGAYWGMGKACMFKNTLKFPCSCKYLCAFVHHVAPQHEFSAIEILDDVLSGVHQDSSNRRDSASVVIPLTTFADGQLWVENAAGTHKLPSGQRGVLHDFGRGPCKFDPHCKHAVLPWHGRRVVLAAYVPRGVLDSPSDLKSELSLLGFVVRVFPRPGLGFPLLDTRISPVALESGSENSAVPATEGGASPNCAELFQSFRGLCPEDLLVIELCAGAAILSTTASKKGFWVLAVDNNQRRAPGKHILRLDLADPQAVSELLEIIRMERDRVALLFISPPCGTASLARERKLMKWARKGFKIPAPLRSRDFPDMLPGIKGWDRAKVELANQLYSEVTRISLVAIGLGILVVLENPASSLYWLTSFFCELAAFCPGYNVDFHVCCHGGQRPKLTRFWTSQQAFTQLSMFCDGSHWHKPWTPRRVGNRLHFVTADEAAYPLLLCQRVIDTLLEMCFPDAPLPSATSSVPFASKHTRIALGAQPRGKALGPLVSEFSHQVAFACAAIKQDASVPFLQSLPKGSKVLRRRLLNGGNLIPSLEQVSDVIFHDMPDLRACSPQTFEEWKLASLEVFFIGVPCTPDVFIERVLQVGHPKGFDVRMEPDVYESIRANFCRDPYPLAKLRIDFVKKWTHRAKELQLDDNKLHNSLPPYLRQVLSGKRLLLLGEMMEEAKCPDISLVQDIRQGFRISGWMPLSGNSRPKVKRPAMSMDTLQILSKGLNKSVLDRLGNRQDPELESAAWQETRKELAAGWTWLANDADISGLLIALRFALRQGPTKIRLIDDCTINGLNNTIGLRECFELHTIDKLAAMAVRALGDASEEGLTDWVGRTFDLRSAYKQYGIHPSDRQRLRIGVNQPGCSRPTLLGVNSLPFGATGSVSAFLRVATAVWRVGLVLLKLVWSSFFDDFSNITRSILASNTRWAIEALFDLLGIDFDRDGKKAPPYSSVFQMLGLQVDLSTSANRRIMIGHTVSRREELTSFLQGILDVGKIEPRTFERLRGRMVFFEGYSFGRVPSCAVRTLAAACKAATSPVSLDAELKNAISTLLRRVASAEPLIVQPISRQTWILFTDGACEPDKSWGGIGAVLFGPNGQVAGFFGESVSPRIMSLLLKQSKSPIFELELAPILISLEHWRSLLCGAQLVCYLDNDGARHTCIRCYAHREPANAWTALIVGAESALGLKSWYARVGTSSNIADGPSRLDFSAECLSGCLRSKPSLASLLKGLG